MSVQCVLHTPDLTRKSSSFTENMAEITRRQSRCSKAEGNWVKKAVLEAFSAITRSCDGIKCEREDGEVGMIRIIKLGDDAGPLSVNQSGLNMTLSHRSLFSSAQLSSASAVTHCTVTTHCGAPLALHLLLRNHYF